MGLGFKFSKRSKSPKMQGVGLFSLGRSFMQACRLVFGLGNISCTCGIRIVGGCSGLGHTVALRFECPMFITWDFGTQGCLGYRDLVPRVDG